MRIFYKLLALLWGALLLSTLASAGVAYYGARSELQDQAHNHLEAVSQTQEGRVNSMVAQHLDRHALVASRTTLRLALERYTADGDPADQALMVRILQEARASVSSFINISAFDLEGTIVASTDPTRHNQTEAQDPVFLKGLQSASVADVRRIDSRVIVLVSGPLMIGNRTIGVLVSQESAQALLGALTNYAGLGQTGETTLARRESDGTVLYLAPLRFDPDAALQRRVDADQVGLAILAALDGQETFHDDLKDYRGEEVLAFTRRIDATGWGLTVKIDKAEAYGPAAELASYLTGVVGLVAMVLGVLAIPAAKAFTGKLERVTATAQAIRGGDLRQRAPVTDKDEVGDLARAFNSMADEVIQTQQNEVARLQQINEFKTEFMNSVAHELNTPLTPMAIELHLLRENRQLAQAFPASLDRLERNLNRLKRLVRDALDASRLQARHLGLNRQLSSIARLAREAVDGYQPTARKKGVTLVCRTQQDALVDVDPQRMAQVLDNLVSNAVKFTPPNGQVVVETGADAHARQVRFLVKDDGAGFTPEQADLLFQPFSQVHKELRSILPGSGLGLYISRSLVELHGGRIRASSEGPGQGATFEVILPWQPMPQA